MTKERFLINGYPNADFATDPADRKSITRTVLIISGAAIIFGCSKQPDISRLTSESEYIGTSEVA